MPARRRAWSRTEDPRDRQGPRGVITLARSGGWLARLIGRPAADGADGASTLESNIRINTLHGITQVMALNMVQPFVGIFAVKLGATNYQIALLSSAPAVVSLLAMIPGARFIDRYPRKKRVTMAFLMAHRTFFLGLACLPFFSPDRRAAVLVALIALMNFPGAIGNISWQSFISGIIPPQLRPTAFAQRNRMMNLIGTLVVLLAGRMLDIISFPLGYQIAFVIAFGLALLERQMLAQVDEEHGVALSSSPAAAPARPGRRERRGAASRGFRYTRPLPGPACSASLSGLCAR